MRLTVNNNDPDASETGSSSCYGLILISKYPRHYLNVRVNTSSGLISPSAKPSGRPLILRSSSVPKTTYKGKSSFQTHADFLQWETFVRDLLATLPPSSALRRGFQTCEHWKQIFMEIIGEYITARSVTAKGFHVMRTEGGGVR